VQFGQSRHLVEERWWQLYTKFWTRPFLAAFASTAINQLLELAVA